MQAGAGLCFDGHTVQPISMYVAQSHGSVSERAVIFLNHKQAETFSCFMCSAACLLMKSLIHAPQSHDTETFLSFPLF